MSAEPHPIEVDFPLRGEWVAVHTPAARVPSHGTHMLGQTYAFDFLRIDRARKGFQFFPCSLARYLLLGVKLSQCYGWSQPIHAPFAGTVVAAKDGWPERDPVHFLRDVAVVLKNALFFDVNKVRDLRAVLGNHIVLKMRGEEVYGFFAHARCGSLRVHEGEELRAGEHLADVGHSGNSTAPHLHFHLMDRASIAEARGLPCCFRRYEALRDGAWERVSGGIPGRREFIRYIAEPA